MRIAEARVIVTSPGRNFVTLKIVTEGGISGIGDATLNGREQAVTAYLEHHVVPLLIGQDAHRIEDIWQQLYRGAYWRRGPVTMTAIAAVDTALWDIKAKACGMPLHQLLGGRSRDGVLVYGHASGRDIEETLDRAAALREQGYRAIRLQTGVPGLGPIYGTPRDGEGRDPSLPYEEVWSSEKYLDHVPKLFEQARLRFGLDLHLLHDAHHRLTPIEAARLGKSLEPYRLFWLEDAVPAENQAGFRTIRRHTVTPLAVGEVFNHVFDAKQLIEEQLIDYIRTTVVHAGGITHLRRIADLAALHHVRTGSHGAGDLSPVCMGAALHFDLWVPNFGIQEYSPHSETIHEVFPNDYRFEDGYMHPSEAPGHGVEIDETRAAEHPYERRYLPVNRLDDGTFWHW